MKSHGFSKLSGEMKRYHCCIGFADDLNVVAIAFSLEFLMLCRMQGKKVHQVHFALDVALCLNSSCC